MTVEMWIKPHDISTDVQGSKQLFQIADEDYENTWQASACSAQAGGWYDFQITQVTDRIHISFTSMKFGSPSCEKDVFGGFLTLHNTNPIHLVVTIKDGEQYIYSDSNSLFETQVDAAFDPSNFDPTYHIDFFSSEYLHHNSGLISHKPWPGQVYLFSIYDKVLTPSEVTANYQAKLGNSLPTVTSTTQAINEDAEITSGGHYSNPVWYEQFAPAADLKELDLSSFVADADTDITSFPNYDENGAKPTLWIGSLPAGGGSLFQSDGTAITTVDTEIAANKIKYRPVLNKVGSSIDSFTFYAKDGGTSEQSVETATVTIDVGAVNDPPVPFNETAAEVVLVGVLATSTFNLNGSDVDDIGLTGGYISRFPAHGDLYKVGVDGAFGAQIVPSEDGSDVIVDGLEVGYKYTGDESSPSETGFLADDTIGFKLFDASNTKGKQGIISFQVFTSLEALPVAVADATPCNEEEFSDVVLKGNDRGNEKRDLKYRIDTLPQHGDIFDPNDLTTALQVGSILTAADVYDSASGAYPGVTIKYKGHKDYFNFPTKRYNGTNTGGSSYDTFGYNAVVSTLVTAKSLAATQSVKVVNVNDPTAVSGPAEPQLVYALSQAEKTEKDKFCEVEENQDKVECTTSDIAKLTSIFFEEVDKNVDRVVVHVSTNMGNGFLSLNQDVLALADFVSCRAPKPSFGRDWVCKGDVISDKEMIFEALPCDLNRLFNGFEYENYVKNSYENITISVFDGDVVDEGCIPSGEHTNSEVSIRGSCFWTNLTIAFQISGYNPDNEDDKDVDGFLPFGIVLPYQAMLGLMGGCAIMACCFTRCLLKCLWRRCCKRKKKEDMTKAAGRVELPEIAGADLEEGTRDNRGGGANHGNGFKDIAKKGLGVAEGGLNKVKKTGVGGPAVGLALKGVKMAGKKLSDGGDEKAGAQSTKVGGNPIRAMSGVNDDEGEGAGEQDRVLPPPPPERVRPPPPPRKKSSKIWRWLGYKDDATGETYYEDTETGRVTWTEPAEGAKIS